MNLIHPTAIVDDRVVMGDNNVIHPYTIIYGPTEIGNENIIGPHVVIGTPGQDTRNPHYDSSNALIKIGDRNIIREFCAIQKPCYEELTYLGSDIFLMQGVHIPHDAHVNDKVVITPLCVLAGITRILEGANLAMGCTINQYCVVGHYSIVATGAALMKNLKPFSKYIPQKPISVNHYAIEKFGFDEFINEITAYVLESKWPSSPKILKIINEFEMLHRKSGRKMY